MATRFYANAQATTLAAACTSVATNISVASTAGLPISYPFIAILDRGESTEEVVLVTGGSGTDLTVTRGYDSTTAFAHSIGAGFVHGFSAIDLREANTHINATSNVHGLAGDLVGTNDTQTLTNKTVALGSNTVSGTKAQFNAAMTDADFATLTGTETLTNKTFTSTSPTVFFHPGSVIMWAVPGGAPTGWLTCNGQEVSRAGFPDLFAAIGTTYGAGNGTTTFNLPDLQLKFPRGAANVSVLGGTGGNTSVTLTTANLPAHNHASGTLSATASGEHTHTLNFSDEEGGTGQNIPEGTVVTSRTSAVAVAANGEHTHAISGSTANTGSGSSFGITPPYLDLNFIIKT